ALFLRFFQNLRRFGIASHFAETNALENPEPVQARQHRAHGLHIFQRDFVQAEAEFLQALNEKPTLTKAYGFLAMLYTSVGRFKDGLQTLAKGYKVDPLFPVLPAVEVSVHFFARDYEAALTCGRKSLELHPYILVGRCYYAQALDFSGRL